jgi:hypothetical protein
MADRYWVGGTGDWDATAGSKWALTSGGAGGQAVPTSSDTVFFDANSGANTITIGSGTAICSTLTMTGFTGTLAFGSNSIDLAGAGTLTVYTGATTFSVTGTPLMLVTGNTGSTRSITTGATTEANSISFDISAGSGVVAVGPAIKNLTFSGTYTGAVTNSARTIYGNLTLKSGMTLTAGGSVTTFAATSGTQTITSAALTLGFPITINAPSATVQLVDALTMGATRTLTLTAGTFDAFNQNVTIGLFSSSNSNTRTLTMGSGTWTLSGAGGIVWATLTITNLTFSGASAPIILSDTSTAFRQFSSGALTFNSLTIGGTTGTSTTVIQCATGTTINTFASTKTVAHTIQVSGGFNFSNWTVTGTAGNLVTINSNSNGFQRTFTYTGSGTISMDYMSIRDINFSYTLGASNPYLVYAGANSTNGGNNSGILFQPTTVKAYRLTTGTSFTTPADWNNASNTIHLLGAGGGGANGASSGNNRAAGGGGGGGGYTVLTNQTLTGAIPYAIGTSAANANGGSTTFNTTNIAGGGLVGTATTVPLSTGGVGGTGVTFNGGNGGAGAFGIVASTGYGSGAGGGAGGPNGVGGNGGAGFGSIVQANASGGGGGGNGGGSNGGNASSALQGNGGNNFSGTGGGVGIAASGTLGGGGAGGVGSSGSGVGGSGIDIANTVGGGGGNGGVPSVNSPSTNTGLYGGGGAGGRVNTGGSAGTAGAGSQGVIFIVYTPSGAPVVANSNFFLMFM